MWYGFAAKNVFLNSGQGGKDSQICGSPMEYLRAILQWNIYMRFHNRIFRFCLNFYVSALSSFETSVEYKQCHMIRLSDRFNEEILIKRLLKNCGPLKIIQIVHH